MQRPWMKQAQYVALTMVGLLAACGTAAPADDGSAADTGMLAFTDAGKDAKDASNVKPDAQDVDNDTGTEPADVTATDADIAADVTGTDAGDADTNGANCASEPGAPGCPCQENGTCDLPICLPTAQGSQCAKACVDTCPDGFKCVGVAGPGGDLQTVCVDKSPHLCDPCVNSSQCGAVGLQGAACVDGGKAGRFCGTACKADGDCPGGYTCGTVTSAEGNSVQQCQPAGGASCTCSASAIADQLSTPCFAQTLDAGGAVVGQCKGVRACAPGGLSACNASIQTETCNGQDDDCDGLVDEGTCDDKNPCTMDTCDGAAQTCGHGNAPGSCDADGNNCTVGDTCVDGKCAIGSLKSCDDNNPCTTDACDPLIGCTKMDDDGLPCSDGSGCTVGDVCTGGACVSGAAKTCPAGDACVSWNCDAANGTCKPTSKPDGTSCSDGTVCTDSDLCTVGSCVGKPVNCDDKEACTLDTCDPVAGCKHVAANTPCDDKNACTEADTCGNSKCSGTPINIATECGDGNPCTTDTCDKFALTLGARCLHTPNTLGCSDGNACTVGDKCLDSACAPGATNTCGCQQNSECASKEDGNPCNGTLYCDPTDHQCKVNSATVVTCNTAGDGPCSQTTCDIATGTCAASKVADGKSCDADGSVCTPNDACQSGACVAGAAKDCNDGNPCTDDSCDGATGCVNAANVSPCAGDGDACTQNDTCVGTVCKLGALKNCDDGSECTVDACDPASGACKNDPTPKNATPCGADSSPCAAGDKCASGTCVAGAAVVCTDTNPCTSDFCDATSGCVHPPMANGTSCGTAGYVCYSSQCVKCGNGKVEPGEQCDDSNLTDGDGCSSTCQWDKAVAPGPGELLITEVMAAPTTAREEWVEIYNNSNKSLLIEGLYFTDNNPSYSVKLSNGSGSWTLKPGEYAIIAGDPKIGGTGGTIVPDFVWGWDSAGIALANSPNNSMEYICIGTDVSCSKGIVVELDYSTNPKSGQSWQLKASKYATAFANGVMSYASSSWCLGSALIPGKDYDLGTPGAPDPNCP